MLNPDGSITMRGWITGRSHRNGPVDVLGNPVDHDEDVDVKLAVTIYPTGAPASIFVVGMESLQRGTLEIGDEITVTIAPVVTAQVDEPAVVEPVATDAGAAIPEMSDHNATEEVSV